MNDNPTTRILQRLHIIAADLSGYAEEDILPEAQFMELGFDSLFLTQLSQAFKDAFGVEITFRHLLDELPTLQAVASHIACALPPEAEQEEAAPPAPQPTTEVPAQAPSQAAYAPPPPTSPLPPIPDFRAAALGEVVGGEGIHAILGEQLRLMNWQIEILLGARQSPGPVQAPADAVAPQPAVEALGDEVAPRTVAPAAAAADGDGPPEMAKEITLASGPPRGTASRDGKRMTPHQEKKLKDLVQRYVGRTAGSRRLTQTYRKVHADPRTAAGFNPLWKDMVYPLVMKRSLGSKLWDVDGNEYIDVLNGFGPNIFGHSAPFVVDAIRSQLDRGFEVGPQTPLAGEAAELVCELTGMDRATFVCTGSEAVQAAIRASRTHTGRTRIVVFEGAYHGNFDMVLVRGANRPGCLRTVPAAPGIPLHAVEDVIVLPYGEPESLEVIREQGDKLAAVLVEPVQSRRPDLQPKEFLQELRSITRERGTVLVFDEVVTGFRCHPGGAQAHFGIEADLATYGKVIGGGLPIGVVAGRDPFMDAFDGGTWGYGDDSFPSAGVTFFAGTFVRHPLAIAAAHASLSYLKAAGPSFQARLNEGTGRLAERLSRLFEERGAPVRISHFASIMYVEQESQGGFGDLFFHLLRLNGLMVAGGYPSYLTAAHSEDDIDQIVHAFAASVDEMQEAGFFPPNASVNGGIRPPVEAPGPLQPATEAPVAGARLGRGPDGSPAWFVPDPDKGAAYLRVTKQEVGA